MNKMDQISSRFRRSKKAAAAALSPASSDQPSPENNGTNSTTTAAAAAVAAGIPVVPAVPEVPAIPAAAAPPTNQQSQHESLPALSVSTTTPPPSSSHSTMSTLSGGHSPNGAQGIRSALQPPKSPFRNFHFRSSNKRARSPAPPTLNIPTAPAVVNQHGSGTVEHEMTSPLRYHQQSQHQLQQQSQQQQQPADGDEMVVDKPKLPAFLSLSDTEMLNKFHNLVWRERNRLLQATQNPSPRFRFAKNLPPESKWLDRYANVQPWANNRVKLQVPQGQADYINASPIVLKSSLGDSESRPSLRYIAMQGPKFNSTSHVWRMVAEQLRSPAVIVMLTETHEGSFEKCYPYFPHSPDDPPIRVNETDEFNDGFRATVRCVGIEESADGAIEARRLEIGITIEDRSHEEDSKAHVMDNVTEGQGQDQAQNGETVPDIEIETEAETETDQQEAKKSNGETKSTENVKFKERTMTVWHLLYKRWPDFGVPDVSDMESFFQLMRLSREKNATQDNPRIIHCSAGVGRSGTFIALEHLLRELELGDLENYDRDHGTIQSSGANGGVSAVGPDLIYDTVNKLREQRRHMVQAESQYIFIYAVLRKLWMDKYGVSATPIATTDPNQRNNGHGNGNGHGHGHGNGNGNGNSNSNGTGADEPAAKRLEIDPNDPFVED